MATLEMGAIVFKGKEPFHPGFFFGGKFSSLGDQKEKRGCNLSQDIFWKKFKEEKVEFSIFQP
jgi:hypothetical protein